MAFELDRTRVDKETRVDKYVRKNFEIVSGGFAPRLRIVGNARRRARSSVWARFATTTMMRGRGVVLSCTFVFALCSRASGTTWTQQQKLTAADRANLDRFGRRVSISGDYAIVAAYWDDDRGNDSGSAYIFTRSGTTWTQQQKLTASDGQGGDNFGFSVSISGDYAIVGAAFDDGQSSNTGSAYIFTRSGTTWTQQQKLTASDEQNGDDFGASVSISGDYAIIGADEVGSSTGSAYIFTRSGTTWTQQQKLTASDAASGDHFGFSVSISGDYAIVGAYLDDSEKGSAYVFHFPPPSPPPSPLPSPLPSPPPSPPPTACGVNERVSSGACVSCPPGTRNNGGDEIHLGDSECSKIQNAGPHWSSPHEFSPRNDLRAAREAHRRAMTAYSEELDRNPKKKPCVYCW